MKRSADYENSYRSGPSESLRTVEYRFVAQTRRFAVYRPRTRDIRSHSGASRHSRPSNGRLGGRRPKRRRRLRRYFRRNSRISVALAVRSHRVFHGRLQRPRYHASGQSVPRSGRKNRHRQRRKRYLSRPCPRIPRFGRCRVARTRCCRRLPLVRRRSAIGRLQRNSPRLARNAHRRLLPILCPRFACNVPKRRDLRPSGFGDRRRNPRSQTAWHSYAPQKSRLRQSVPVAAPSARSYSALGAPARDRRNHLGGLSPCAHRRPRHRAFAPRRTLHGNARHVDEFSRTHARRGSPRHLSKKHRSL